MSFRIGSTRPIPMNAITQAKATAQTARGWEKNDPDATGGWWYSWAWLDTDFLSDRAAILHREPMNSGDHSGDPGHSPRRVRPRGRRRPPWGSQCRSTSGRAVPERLQLVVHHVAEDRHGVRHVVDGVPGPGEPLGEGGAVLAAGVSEALWFLRREPDDGAPGVAGVRVLGHPPLVGQLAHRPRHGG